MPAAESKYTEIIALCEATTTPELQEVLAFALKNRARIWAGVSQGRRNARCQKKNCGDNIEASMVLVTNMAMHTGGTRSKARALVMY